MLSTQWWIGPKFVWTICLSFVYTNKSSLMLNVLLSLFVYKSTICRQITSYKCSRYLSDRQIAGNSKSAIRPFSQQTNSTGQQTNSTDGYRQSIVVGEEKTMQNMESFFSMRVWACPYVFEICLPLSPPILLLTHCPLLYYWRAKFKPYCLLCLM